MLADIVDVAQHVIVPETQNRPAIRLKTPSTLPVVVSTLRSRMLRTIDLDDQSMRGTGEIHDVTGDRNLPAKTKPYQPMRTQFIPELGFRLRHGIAHAAGVAANFRRYVSVRHGEAPPTGDKKRAHGCRRRPSELKAKDQSLLSMRADITSTDMSPE